MPGPVAPSKPSDASSGRSSPCTALSWLAASSTCTRPKSPPSPIASIHAKRDEFREQLEREGGLSEKPLLKTSSLRERDDPRVHRYASAFADMMEMRAPAAVVAGYLDRHEGWFRRCAAPMARWTWTSTANC